MNIALFDIDGTLTESNEIDSLSFADAFRDVFGVGIDTDWDSYLHTTDQGIVVEALRRARGREADAREIALYRTRFVQLLGERMTELNEVPGAAAFLAQMQARDWRVVLCTGAWSDSARLKLTRAGLPAGLPLASCDDDIAREDILRRGRTVGRAGSGESQPAIHRHRGGRAPTVCAGVERPRSSLISRMPQRCSQASIGSRSAERPFTISAQTAQLAIS